MPGFALGVLVSLVLVGCATVPVPLTRGPFADLTPKTALESGTIGQKVRWGGEIVSASPRPKETCFEILSRPLDGEARPKQTDETYGRFLGCADGFYDPAAYPANREITVVGTVQPAVTLRIGEYEYHAPRVEIRQLYLWPKWEVVAYPYRYYDPFWDPWRYPWPYYRYPFYPYF